MALYEDYAMPDAAPAEPREQKRASRAAKTKPKAEIPYLSLEAGLPCNIDAERTILGAVLLDNAAHIEAADKLTDDDFSLDSHRRIFQRMTELMESNHAVDIVTLANALTAKKEIEAVGGVAYLASLTEGLPRRPVIGEYVRIVKSKSLLRKLMGICSAAIARAADQSEDSFDLLSDTESRLQALMAAGISSSMERIGDYFEKHFPTADSLIEKTAKSQGLETGFREFDRMTCGLQKGELIIIAARPSMGKSSLMWNLAEHVGLLCEGRIAIFSLEMSKESLLRRGICSRGRVPLQDHRSGDMRLHPQMVDRFSEAYDEIRRAAIFIDDTPKTASRICVQARALKTKGGLDLVMVDHLGMILHDDYRIGGRNETWALGMDCLLLKNLAKELDLPVTLLCQLNRELTKREDKRPKLQDLRESGRVEEIADTVAFIHREEYYNRDDKNLRGKGEEIIAKQRNGPTGTIPLLWEAEYTRWSDPPDPNELNQGEFGLSWK